MPRNASLFTEIIVAITLILVIAGRMNLGDFAVVLPVGLVVAGVGLVAFAVQKRFLFWCGALGATFGGICPKPRFELLFNPDADPADTAMIWCRMMGEVNLLCAFVGSMTGVAIACAVSHFHRRYASGG